MNISIRKFDMKKIGDEKIVIVLGRRGSGKSIITKDILFHKNYIPAGTVISPTENANSFYKKFVPRMFIHHEYDESITRNFMKRQKKMRKLINNGENIDDRAYLIFDDCLYDNAWKKDKNILEIFLNGRHWHVFYCLLLQFPLGIAPNLRSNIDFVFIFRENVLSNRKRIFDHYAGCFGDFNLFCEVMDQCTQNYECLVIDYTTQSNKLEDQIYWYKAEMHPDFRMGPDEIWDYNDANFKEDDDADEEDDITNYRKKKGPKLNVKKLDARVDNHD